MEAAGEAFKTQKSHSFLPPDSLLTLSVQVGQVEFKEGSGRSHDGVCAIESCPSAQRWQPSLSATSVSSAPRGLQALAARLFDVSRMCLTSDSVSDDIGLFSVTLCFAFQMCATVQPGPANEGGGRGGRETREVQRERERAG